MLIPYVLVLVFGAGRSIKSPILHRPHRRKPGPKWVHGGVPYQLDFRRGQAVGLLKEPLRGRSRPEVSAARARAGSMLRVYSSRNALRVAAGNGCFLLLFHPMFPVTRPLLAVHDGDNPDAVWLIEIDHGVGENGSEVAAGRRIKYPKQIGLPAHSLNQPLDLVVEPPAQSRLDLKKLKPTAATTDRWKRQRFARCFPKLSAPGHRACSSGDGRAGERSAVTVPVTAKPTRQHRPNGQRRCWQGPRVRGNGREGQPAGPRTAWQPGMLPPLQAEARERNSLASTPPFSSEF